MKFIYNILDLVLKKKTEKKPKQTNKKLNKAKWVFSLKYVVWKKLENIYNEYDKQNYKYMKLEEYTLI